MFSLETQQNSWCASYYRCKLWFLPLQIEQAGGCGFWEQNFQWKVFRSHTCRKV